MKRILIVDDDEDILESLELLLQSTYRLTTARNGREALSILLDNPSFDAVVLDLMMPVMDGETLLQQLAACELKVPVILVSARDDVGIIAQTHRAADHVLKPFDIGVLRAKIARIVGGPGGSDCSGGTSGSAVFGDVPGNERGDCGKSEHGLWPVWRQPGPHHRIIIQEGGLHQDMVLEGVDDGHS